MGRLICARTIVTSLLAGRLGDVLGRRRTLFFGASIFVIGGAIQVCMRLHSYRTCPSHVCFAILVWSHWLRHYGTRKARKRCRSWVTIVCSQWFKSQYLTNLRASTIVPIYQSEVSPADHVGISGGSLLIPFLINIPARQIGMYRVHREHCRLCVFSCKCSNEEESFAYLSLDQWLDYFCSFIESDMAWRFPLLMQCIIGVILAVGSLMMPESPR